MKFNYQTREHAIEKLQDRTLDLLIIGGGITGAGVALQAAASGLETGLIEMQDFAEGTSSRSTKLVHGGIRYLKNFDVEVVADTVGERAVVQQIAPHVPKPDPMLMPIYDEEGSTFSMFRLKVAMNLYDSLAGINSNSEFANTMLTKEEVLEHQPNLKQEGLLGGGQYLDFNNSDIRLVVENIKRANQDGALIASRVKAVDYTFDDNGKVNGVVAEDLLNGKKFEINARYFINTTGPWSDKTRNLNKPEHPIEMMRPTKGVHLVIDRSKLEVSQPIYFDSGYNDGRMIFVIPREKKTYFGTTDTDYHGDFEHPTVTQADVDYLLKAVNNRFPKANITLDDIESSWAGLRPLIAGNAASDYNGGDNGKISDDSFNGLIDTVQSYLKKDKTRDDVEKAITNLQGSLSEKELSPSEVSRGSSLEQDDNGLITLAGGKITDYRKMAAGAMELIIKLLAENYDKHYQLINSKTYPVSGGEINPNDIESAFDAYAQMGVTRGLEREDAYYLASFFGSNAPQVYAYVDKVPAVEGMSLAETVMLFYSLDNECVLTPNDYFLRRTNYMLFMRDKMDRLIDPVLNIMQEYFGWSDEEKQNHMDHLQKALYDNDLIALKEHK